MRERDCGALPSKTQIGKVWLSPPRGMCLQHHLETRYRPQEDDMQTLQAYQVVHREAEMSRYTSNLSYESWVEMWALALWSEPHDQKAIDAVVYLVKRDQDVKRAQARQREAKRTRQYGAFLERSQLLAAEVAAQGKG